MMGDSISGIILAVTDHVFRRYALPLVLLTASVLRYNVYSLVYLTLFLIGVVITGPRHGASRVICIVYLVTVLTLSLLFGLSQGFFQISLATGPKLAYCDSLEVILRQIGLIQYTSPIEDIIRHLSLDVLVAIVASVSVGVSIKVATLHNKREGGSLDDTQDSISSGTEVPRAEQSTLTEFSSLSITSTTNTKPPQSYHKLPKWVLSIFDLLIFFLFGLTGVAVPSIVSFWYFSVFLLLCIMWSTHFKYTESIGRVLRLISIVYSAIHILALYLYQFQSFQLAAPLMSFDNTNNLLVRLFGLTPIIQTSCESASTLAVWSDTPLFYIINPWALLALYWVLGSDFQLWLSTPKPFWSLYSTYCMPKISSSSDQLRIQERGRSNMQHYGATADSQLGKPSEQEGSLTDAANETSNDYSEIVDTEEHSKPYMTLLAIRQKMVYRVIELWNRLMSVSYVFSLVAMMVWSVLYPSWPGLVLLLWAVVIWVIPRVNPKQLLQYSSPLLVVYAIGLLLLSFVNALPVTSNGFTWGFKVGIECKFTDDNIQDCLSGALGIKSLLALIFFASLHQLIQEFKDRQRNNRQGDTQLLTANQHDEDAAETSTVSILYAEIYLALTTYWVVAVLGAFLLVILVGQPSVLKTVYLAALFVFFLFYQLFRKWWVYISYPLWWLLVVYAALHLVIVYTFQFDEITDLWYKAYNQSNFTHHFNASQVFSSIGFESSDYDRSRALFELLVPLAIFVAVIALQVRYFTPRTAPEHDSRVTQDHISVAQVLTGLTRAVTLTDIQFGDIEKDIERQEQEKERRRERRKSINEALEEVDLTDMKQEEDIGDGWEVAGARETTPTDSSLGFYRILVYSLIKLRQFIILVWHLLWRFFEIHTSKLVVVAIFAYGLYELSATYFFVIVVVVVITPLPFLNPILYPLLTIYLGILSIGKYTYQFPIVSVFNVIKDCNASNISTEIPGTIFHYSFSPQSSDSSWTGLNQTNHSITYVGSLIMIALLICLWYASKRHQMFYYSTNGISIDQWEFRSLFLGVDYSQIHLTVTDGLKFLVNHWFDMYGIEVCFIFEAILIAARIDVYGIIYVVILGLMLIAPRTLLAPVWLLFLVLHGLILILQYALLVGLPPSLICKQEGYPWAPVFSENDFAAMERWLYLPHTGKDTLNKYLLYADLFAYLMICLQMRNFISSPINMLRRRHMLSIPTDIYKTRFWFDSIKILVFQYSFWVTLFILFGAAATKLSLIGLTYLLLCFVFLYRGQNLLTDLRKNRIRWWSVLRWFIWGILFLRSILQLIGCVFGNHGILNESSPGSCFLVSVFTIRCARNSYYGINTGNKCNYDNEASTGLWLDVLAFACITLQMIALDTPYAEQVRDKMIKKEEDAENFAAVKNQLMEEKIEMAKKKEQEEIMELKERAELLKLTEGRIDHFLYAGVRVPPDYLSSVKNEVTSESVAKNVESPEHKPAPEQSSETSEITDSKEKDSSEAEPNKDTKLEVGVGFVKKWLLFFYELWLTVTDSVIEWLEMNSHDYRQVVSRLKTARYQHGRDALLETTEPSPPSDRRTSEPDRERIDTIQEEDDDESQVKSKPRTDDSRDAQHSPRDVRSLHFDESADTLINVLQPSQSEEQQAKEIQSKFGDFTRKHSARPRRFFTALYYWCLSHFEYVVFFFVTVAIITTGSLPSFIYAILLFLWGLLSLPLPTKRFWLALIFYTMLVMIVKYIYSFFFLSLIKDNLSNNLYNYNWLGIQENNMLAWIFGVRTSQSYFTNAVVNLLLLMILMFQRGLLKQYGLWTDNHSIKMSSKSPLKQFVKPVKYFFKQVLESTSVAGRKDYYVWMLICDVLCFLTIAFGYSYFSVTPSSTGSELTQVATFIQSDNIPLPFLIMLMLQFISMLVDRSIYVSHSVMGKLIFYIFLLVGWHIWLLIVVPLITHISFFNNPAAQLLYFFKSGYFVLSALQIISGYPRHLLGYFFGKSYSTISGVMFSIYRIIPIIPELREVTDWVFTDTSLSFIHWLRVQELWAQLYQVKVRRMREKSYPRDLGEKQSLISKVAVGGGFVIALVLLIWGPLILISLINEASVPNPPLSGTVSLSLEGSQLLQIQAQSQFVFDLSSKQYTELRGKVRDQSLSVWSEFNNLFRKENFRHILFPGNTSIIWTASPTTKEQLRSILMDKDVAKLTFTWSIMRSVSGAGDETVTGSNDKNITGDTIQKFIEYLNDSATSSNNSIPLDNIYPLLIFSPTTGVSTEFTQLSQYIKDNTFNGTASLSTNVAYTLRESNSTLNDTKATIITEWWTLEPTGKQFLVPSEKEMGIMNALEMVIYSETVSPPILSFVASIGVIGLYISVVLVIGRFIRGYVSSLPQNLLIDQIANPDPLLKLCDDIFFVREMKNLILEEILVGKLYYIFRSPERLISLTDESNKEKTD